MERVVIFINDIIHEEGRLLTFQEFENKYFVKTNLLVYEGVKRAVVSYFNRQGKKLHENLVSPFIVSHVNLKLSNTSICMQHY